MIELKRITVKEYLTLEDKSQYDFAMKFALQFNESVNEFEIQDVFELPFGFVLDYQFELSHDMTLLKQIELIQTITDRKIGDMLLDVFCRGCKWLNDGIFQIAEIERQKLSYTPTYDEQSAGIENLFEGLEYYMKIRKLAGNDITKIEQVRALPYSRCFLELYTQKQEYEYQQNIIKNQKR